MTIAAAQNVKPVRNPKKMFSQLTVEKCGADARTAPTRTAKPIIVQLTGRINRMKPPSLFMLFEPFYLLSYWRLPIKLYTKRNRKHRFWGFCFLEIV